MNFNGWNQFMQMNMVCLEDIQKLWDLEIINMLFNIKHDYKTKIKTKYWGNKNEDYPEKIGSLIL